jgi:hypothetical protein
MIQPAQVGYDEPEDTLRDSAALSRAAEHNARVRSCGHRYARFLPYGRTSTLSRTHEKRPPDWRNGWTSDRCTKRVTRLKRSQGRRARTRRHARAHPENAKQRKLARKLLPLVKPVMSKQQIIEYGTPAAEPEPKKITASEVIDAKYL